MEWQLKILLGVPEQRTDLNLIRWMIIVKSIKKRDATDRIQNIKTRSNIIINSEYQTGRSCPQYNPTIKIFNPWINVYNTLTRSLLQAPPDNL